MSEGTKDHEKVIQAARRIIASADEQGLFTAREIFVSAVKEITEIGIKKGVVSPEENPS